jgi:hypothetical protein
MASPLRQQIAHDVRRIFAGRLSRQDMAAFARWAWIKAHTSHGPTFARLAVRQPLDRYRLAVSLGMIRFAAARAPKGGVNIGGKFYPGGKFIPGKTQAEVDKAAAKQDDGKPAAKGSKTSKASKATTKPAAKKAGKNKAADTPKIREQKEKLRRILHRAPAGGAWVGEKFYRGGQIVSKHAEFTAYGKDKGAQPAPATPATGKAKKPRENVKEKAKTVSAPATGKPKEKAKAKPVTLRDRILDTANNHPELQQTWQSIIDVRHNYYRMLNERDKLQREESQAYMRWEKTQSAKDKEAHAAALEKYRAAKAAAKAEESKQLERAHAALALPHGQGAKIAAKFSRVFPLEGEHQHTVLRAGQFVERMVKLDGQTLPVDHAALPRDARAYYRNENKTCWTAPNDEPRVAVHELGHHIENTVPGVREAAQVFLAHRLEQAGKPDVRLKEQFPDSRYREDEIGNEDGFTKAFGSSASYVGKRYESGDTEIVSMGLEYLYHSPYRLAEDDPEFFKFIVGVLRGHITGKAT